MWSTERAGERMNAMDQGVQRAVEAVVEAWTVEGPNPKHHRLWQQRVMEEWPTLAIAIINLVHSVEFPHQPKP